MTTIDEKYLSTLETLYGMMPDFQQVGAGAYKPGLERVEAFDRYLGRPSRDFVVIHIAGTNGKGSVSHMLASVLMQAGYRTGLYTSPHISDFRERIRIDGHMIPRREVVRFAESHMEKMRELKLSFFEATVGMAFRYFSSSDVEVAVVETGLGGRLDATNIVAPVLSVITNIGLEHTSFLGDTVEAIAAEKGGLLKSGVPVLIGQRDERTAPVFEAIARREGSPIVFAEDYFRTEPAGAESEFNVLRLKDDVRRVFRLDLSGDYQGRNLTTALAALSVMNRLCPLSVSIRALQEGVETAAASTGLHGRWEVAGRDPLTVCDTGHNAHGLREVVKQIGRQKYDKLYVVFGVADDKDLDAILPLLPQRAHYIFTRASVGRAMPAQTLAAKAAQYGLRGETATDVPAALARARELAAPQDMIFVGGSTFVVADSGLTEMEEK